MKKLLLILVLLVSGNTIGQEVRNITVQQLSNVPTYYHIHDGTFPRDFNYPNGRAAINTRGRVILGLNFDPNGIQSEGGTLVVGRDTYVIDRAYGDVLERNFWRRAYAGNGFALNDAGGDAPAGVLPAAIEYPEWGSILNNNANLSPTTATSSWTQNRFSITTPRTEQTRTVDVRRLTSETAYALSHEEGNLNASVAIGTDLEAARAAAAAVGSYQPLYSAWVITYQSSVDGVDIGPIQTHYGSGYEIVEYFGAQPFFTEIHNDYNGRFGARTTGYYTYEVYDTTITYSFANGGEWRVDGSKKNNTNTLKTRATAPPSLLGIDRNIA